MAIVVVGAVGWLGSAILEQIPVALPVRRPAELDTVLAQAGPEAVVVNAAGRARGRYEELWSDNVELVQRLLARRGWLVQLGSAAEYGLGVTSPVAEDSLCAPSSDYGRSKHEATRLAVDSGRATVLRLFNLIDSPPQPGSPIADIAGRIRAGVDSGTPIEVLSGGTVRDYVSRSYVAKCVAFAVEQQPVGLFNVGSGQGVSVRDIAVQAAAQLGSSVTVCDRQTYPATTIFSDPSAWQSVSGLRQRLDAAAVAGFLTR